MATCIVTPDNVPVNFLIHENCQNSESNSKKELTDMAGSAWMVVCDDTRMIDNQSVLQENKSAWHLMEMYQSMLISTWTI